MHGTCVGWQVTLCDPIWQVTSRSSEVGLPPQKAISAFTIQYNNVIYTALFTKRPGALTQLAVMLCEIIQFLGDA